jgi:hypothetical protein
MKRSAASVPCLSDDDDFEIVCTPTEKKQRRFKQKKTMGKNPMGKKWACSVCTFKNDVKIDKCQMCTSPELPIISPSGQTSHSASKASTKSQVAAVQSTKTAAQVAKHRAEAHRYLVDMGKDAKTLEKNSAQKQKQKEAAQVLTYARQMLCSTAGHALTSVDLYTKLKHKHTELRMEQKEFLKQLKLQATSSRNIRCVKLFPAKTTNSTPEIFQFSDGTVVDFSVVSARSAWSFSLIRKDGECSSEGSSESSSENKQSSSGEYTPLERILQTQASTASRSNDALRDSAEEMAAHVNSGKVLLQLALEAAIDRNGGGGWVAKRRSRDGEEKANPLGKKASKKRKGIGRKNREHLQRLLGDDELGAVERMAIMVAEYPGLSLLENVTEQWLTGYCDGEQSGGDGGTGPTEKHPHEQYRPFADALHGMYESYQQGLHSGLLVEEFKNAHPPIDSNPFRELLSGSVSGGGVSGSSSSNNSSNSGSGGSGSSKECSSTCTSGMHVGEQHLLAALISLAAEHALIGTAPASSKLSLSSSPKQQPMRSTCKGNGLKMRRPKCGYGRSCYRNSSQHKQESSHPGDSDWVEDSVDSEDGEDVQLGAEPGLWECSDCTYRNKMVSSSCNICANERKPQVEPKPALQPEGSPSVAASAVLAAAVADETSASASVAVATLTTGSAGLIAKLESLMQTAIKEEFQFRGREASSRLCKHVLEAEGEFEHQEQRENGQSNDAVVDDELQGEEDGDEEMVDAMAVEQWEGVDIEQYPWMSGWRGAGQRQQSKQCDIREQIRACGRRPMETIPALKAAQTLETSIVCANVLDDSLVRPKRALKRPLQHTGGEGGRETTTTNTTKTAKGKGKGKTKEKAAGSATTALTAAMNPKAKAKAKSKAVAAGGGGKAALTKSNGSSVSGTVPSEEEVMRLVERDGRHRTVAKIVEDVTEKVASRVVQDQIHRLKVLNQLVNKMETKNEIPVKLWDEMFAGRMPSLLEIKSEVAALDELVNHTDTAALGANEQPAQLPPSLRLGPLKKQQQYQKELVAAYRSSALAAEKELLWRLGVLAHSIPVISSSGNTKGGSACGGVSVTARVTLAVCTRDTVLARKRTVDAHRTALGRAEEMLHQFSSQIVQLEAAINVPISYEAALSLLGIKKHAFESDCELGKGQRLLSVRYKAAMMELKERFGAAASSDENEQKSERSKWLNEAKDVLEQKASQVEASAKDLLLEFS